MCEASGFDDRIPPAHFVAYAASRGVDEFLAGNWRAMFLVGDAGIGKSQLLVYLFRSVIKAKRHSASFFRRGYCPHGGLTGRLWTTSIRSLKGTLNG
jgi:hypothetical protein